MNRLLKGIAVFIALVGVGVASAFAVVALLLRQEEVRVPDLVGRDIVSVLETASQAGLQLRVDRREPSPTMPRDTVISQAPPAGSGLKKGRQVRVVVSQGPSELLAPKAVGENFRKADLLIRQAGFLPGDVSRTYSDTVERDVVIAQEPAPGSPLEKNGSISVLVSSGKQPDLFVMPGLTGNKLEDALRTIDRLGLQHRVLTRTAADGSRPAERVVVSQKPAAGYPVSPEMTVDIVVTR